MGANNTEIIEKFCKSLRSGGYITKEHRDYILIKELYHCTPEELEKQEEATLSLHYNMLMKEREHEHIEYERQKQRRSQQALNKPKR